MNRAQILSLRAAVARLIPKPVPRCEACGGAPFPAWKIGPAGGNCPACGAPLLTLARDPKTGARRILHNAAAREAIEAERGPLDRWAWIDGQLVDTDPGWRRRAVGRRA